MTKKILISTVVAAALATSALADNTFNAASGSTLNGSGLNNYHTDDIFNIYANPANLMDHKGKSIIEIANGNNEAAVAGTAIDLGGAGVLGLFVGRTDTSGADSLIDNTIDNGVRTFGAQLATDLSAIPGAPFGVVTVDNLLAQLGNQQVATHDGVQAPKMTDILYATDLGGTQIGARFSIGKSSMPTEIGDRSAYTSDTIYTDVAIDGSAEVTDMSFEVGAKMGKLKFSAGVDMARANNAALLTTTDVAGSVTTTTINAGGETLVRDAGMSISANAQYDMSFGKTPALVTAFFSTNDQGFVHAKHAINSVTVAAGETSEIDTTTVTNTTTRIGADVAFKTVNSADTKVTIVTGLTYISQNMESAAVNVDMVNDVTSFDGTTDSSQTAMTTVMIPLTLAIEKKVSNGFTLRGGASGNIYGGMGGTNTVDTWVADGVKTSKIAYSTESTFRYDLATSATISTGFTYNVAKNLDVVGVVSTNFWLTGPDFITGAGTTNNTLASAAITYNY